MSEEIIVDPNTGGRKGRKDERYDLIPWDAMDEVARVYGFGSSKYEDWNWLKGYKWSLSFGALIRHIALWGCGQDRDRESGLHHLAHAAWHCLALLAFAFRRVGTDDRRKATLSFPPPGVVIVEREPSPEQADGREPQHLPAHEGEPELYATTSGAV
jgi:hypothetical protein